MLRKTMEMVMDDKVIEAIVSMLMELQKQDNVNLPVYEQQLKETNAAIENMLNAIQMGVLTRSTKDRLEALESARDEWETKIACEKMAKPRITEDQMTFWLHRFRKLDIQKQEHQKMLINTFVNSIYLYDDKLLLTFNFKDGTKTVSFDEVKKAEGSVNPGSDMDDAPAPHRSKRHVVCSDFLSNQRMFILLSYLFAHTFFINTRSSKSHGESHVFLLGFAHMHTEMPGKPSFREPCRASVFLPQNIPIGPLKGLTGSAEIAGVH